MAMLLFLPTDTGVRNLLEVTLQVVARRGASLQDVSWHGSRSVREHRLGRFANHFGAGKVSGWCESVTPLGMGPGAQTDSDSLCG